MNISNLNSQNVTNNKKLSIQLHVVSINFQAPLILMINSKCIEIFSFFLIELKFERFSVFFIIYIIF